MYFAVFNIPSSKSIFELNPKTFFAFSTLGILIATSADNGGSKIILDLDSRTLQMVWARPKIVTTALGLPILKLSPIALGLVIQLIKQSTKSST